jgi:hypothetical protein
MMGTLDANSKRRGLANHGSLFSANDKDRLMYANQ